MRDKLQALELRLSDEKTVEGVCVMQRKACSLFGMWARDGEIVKPAVTDSNTERLGELEPSERYFDSRLPH